MVIGSILSDIKFTEEELVSELENKFEYKELMANSYWMDNSPANNDEPKG